MSTEDKELLLKDLCARLPYRNGEHWECNSTKEVPFPVLPTELSTVSMWLNKTNLTWKDEPIEI